MKTNFLTIIFSVVLILVQLNLRPEKRQELLDKLTTKISISDIEENLDKFNYEQYFEEDFQKMTYDINEIKSLMAQYGLPESYDYFEKTGATKIIKNQELCGCCWSFSSTSALAYRFKKYGIDLSLSPQDGVSCYKRDCLGTNLIDPQLNLVKNGSVTEECFPYKSADGETIPECPSQCENGSEFKKYHSQNAYLAENYDQEKFNDLVILVMDQLVTQGPIMAGFDVKADFDRFGEDQQKCKTEVYSYDGQSESTGGHAITIVGYGILNNKIYWLVQNSWGADWCDNGFIKMEIGQFIEISFSEPLIIPENPNPVQIEVNFKRHNFDCMLVVESPSLNDWNNTLNVVFKHETTNKLFEFQIGKNKIKGIDQIVCNYELNHIYYHMKRGKYIYQDFNTLGKDNTFKLNSFQGKSFTFHGGDEISAFIYKQYLVSQVGSRILFQNLIGADDGTVPKLYMGDKFKRYLSKCEHVKTSTDIGLELGYCEITEDDLAYIESSQGVQLSYYYLCNYIYDTQIILGKLDINKYPVFKVVQLLKPAGSILTNKTDIILVSNATGGVKYFQNGENFFYVIMEIENNNQNTSVLSSCSAEINYENTTTNLTCNLELDNLNIDSLPYQNIYLLPYFRYKQITSHFEVFIKTTIKSGDDPINPDIDPTPKPAGKSSNLEYSLILLFGLISLLF